MAALFARATSAEAWIGRDGAHGLKVNDEDERPGLMRNLSENLTESARVVEDLQCVNDEIWIEQLGLKAAFVTWSSMGSGSAEIAVVLHGTRSSYAGCRLSCLGSRDAGGVNLLP